jgi:hypothetical protein
MELQEVFKFTVYVITSSMQSVFAVCVSVCVLLFVCIYWGVPGSSVGIATGYGLDGPGIESRWGLDFLHLFRPALGPTQPPV